MKVNDYDSIIAFTEKQILFKILKLLPIYFNSHGNQTALLEIFMQRYEQTSPINQDRHQFPF